MAWVKSDYAWPRRGKVFSVRSERLKEALETCDTPDALEAMVRKIVVGFRPELAGCNIWFMRFDELDGLWKIAIEHETGDQMTETSCQRVLVPLVEDDA